MLNNWKKYKLKDLTTKIGSGSTPRGGDSAYINEGISLIRSQNILDFTFSYNGLAHINEQQAKELNGVTIYKDDVLINITGDSVARVSQVPDDVLPARVNQHVAILRANQETLNSNFLKYYLLQPRTKADLLSISSSGATRKAITKVMLEEFPITVPPLPEQQAIAEILSSLDDKIELNLQTNKTLEEMANALYKHWFVDFGPFLPSGRWPQDGRGPIPGFIESELGLIPEGWEVVNIGDFVETLGGGTPSTTNSEFWNDGNINWYSPTDLTKQNSLFSSYTEKKITELGLAKSSARMFPPYSLLMSSRATIGLITINTISSCTNQGFITLLPNKTFSLYQLHGWLKSNMELIISKANGSTFKEISKSNFRELKILKAKNIDSFISNSKEIFSLIENNIDENISLKQTRDYLLPKLISGEIRVKDVNMSEVLGAKDTSRPADTLLKGGNDKRKSKQLLKDGNDKGKSEQHVKEGMINAKVDNI